MLAYTSHLEQHQLFASVLQLHWKPSFLQEQEDIVQKSKLTSFNNTEARSKISWKIWKISYITLGWRMNGTKGHSEINIPPGATKAKQQETGKHAGIGGFSYKAWTWKVWEFAKEDSNRVKFSFLLILCQAPYAIFGTNIIWSILTVVVMFECTVGKYKHYSYVAHSFSKYKHYSYVQHSFSCLCLYAYL